MRGVAVVAGILFLGSAVVTAEPAAKKSTKTTGQKVATNVPAGIPNGRPSSLIHCVGAKAVNTHDLGWVPSGAQITIRFISNDFDPVASVLGTALGSFTGNANVARHAYVADDDTGGGNDPEIRFTSSFDAQHALFVGSYDGAFGCYVYQVDIVLP